MRIEIQKRALGSCLPKQIARARCQVSDLHIDLLRVCDAIHVGPANVRLHSGQPGPQRGGEGSEVKLEQGKTITACKTIMAQGERSEQIFWMFF